ncbi:oxygenase MpaB family protein [Streptomyces sp. ODS28]|uniref:oxygenase MpaB family protein n=1 Tax=Streptomyces sp. ODS28 TaxID=3136688 RepID=UPI0031EC0BCF
MPLTAANVEGEMEAANQAGDPPADALVSDLIDRNEVDGVNGLFRTIGTLKPGQDHSQLPPRLAEFLKDASDDPPGWSDADAAAAEGFFRNHHGEASMLQGTVGLIGTYLSPTGAFTLRSTGRLGGVEGPGRRLSQSSRLFIGMGDDNALRDGSLKATVTKVRLVHSSVRQLHKKSGEWDYEKWGEPVSQKYTAGAICVFSVQILEALENLGVHVSDEDRQGFMCAWHYINHYLGTPEKWLMPKDADEVDRLWRIQRETEWKETEDGKFMTEQALKFYREEMVPPPLYDPFVAMVRKALGDEYADKAGIPSNAVLDTGAEFASAGHDLASSTFGGVLGGAAEEATGTNPYDAILGKASKAFNKIQEYALTHDKDKQPQMHQELHDNR